MAKRNRVGIGLDVGSRTIQVAVLRSGKNAMTVERLMSRDLPHDAIVEGVVMDAHLVCEHISQLLKDTKLVGKEAAIAVGGRRVTIRRIATDEMSDEELKAAIAFEAKSKLPFDLEEVSLDYSRLPEDAETGRMDVLLVAARNEHVFDAVQTLRWAGAKPLLLEAEPFALQAALAEAGYLEEQEVVAALHIGFQSTDVTIFRNAQFESNRNLSIGGRFYVDGLIRELGITFERAVSLLGASRHSREEQEALDKIAADISEKLAEQVERSFPEHFGGLGDQSVSKIVLCGGGAHLPMLESALKRRFSLNVEIVDPVRRFELNPKHLKPDQVVNSPEYTAAVGLALRAMGDDHPGFNLLFPTDRPEHRKTTYAGAGTVLPILGASAVLFAMVMMYISQEARLSALRSKLDEIKKETALYSDKIALVEELTAKRADVAARMDVISNLDRNRFSRIKLMQTLNDALPDLTWFTSVQENPSSRGPGVKVTGVSSSNLKVSQLMTNLLMSRYVKGVDLVVSEQAEISGTDVTNFTLQVTMPDLGLARAEPAKPVDQIKRGAQALKEKRKAEDELKQQASK